MNMFISKPSRLGFSDSMVDKSSVRKSSQNTEIIRNIIDRVEKTLNAKRQQIASISAPPITKNFISKTDDLKSSINTLTNFFTPIQKQLDSLGGFAKMNFANSTKIPNEIKDNAIKVLNSFVDHPQVGKPASMLLNLFKSKRGGDMSLMALNGKQDALNQVMTAVHSS